MKSDVLVFSERAQIIERRLVLFVGEVEAGVELLEALVPRLFDDLQRLCVCFRRNDGHVGRGILIQFLDFVIDFLLLLLGLFPFDLHRPRGKEN